LLLSLFAVDGAAQCFPGPNQAAVAILSAVTPLTSCAPSPPELRVLFIVTDAARQEIETEHPQFDNVGNSVAGYVGDKIADLNAGLMENELASVATVVSAGDPIVMGPDDFNEADVWTHGYSNSYGNFPHNGAVAHYVNDTSSTLKITNGQTLDNLRQSRQADLVVLLNEQPSFGGGASACCRRGGNPSRYLVALDVSEHHTAGVFGSSAMLLHEIIHLLKGHHRDAIDLSSDSRSVMSAASRCPGARGTCTLSRIMSPATRAKVSQELPLASGWMN
jgi:hypothetical protein